MSMELVPVRFAPREPLINVEAREKTEVTAIFNNSVFSKTPLPGATTGEMTDLHDHMADHHNKMMPVMRQKYMKAKRKSTRNKYYALMKHHAKQSRKHQNLASHFEKLGEKNPHLKNTPYVPLSQRAAKQFGNGVIKGAKLAGVGLHHLAKGAVKAAGATWRHVVPNVRHAHLEKFHNNLLQNIHDHAATAMTPKQAQNFHNEQSTFHKNASEINHTVANLATTAPAKKQSARTKAVQHNKLADKHAMAAAEIKAPKANLPKRKPATTKLPKAAPTPAAPKAPTAAKPKAARKPKTETNLPAAKLTPPKNIADKGPKVATPKVKAAKPKPLPAAKGTNVVPTNVTRKTPKKPAPQKNTSPLKNNAPTEMPPAKKAPVKRAISPNKTRRQVKTKIPNV